MLKLDILHRLMFSFSLLASNTALASLRGEQNDVPGVDWLAG